VSNPLPTPYICGFPWSIIQKSFAPSKVPFFVLKTSQGKILTCDNLQKKGATFVQ